MTHNSYRESEKVCVCVCVHTRERERESERERERDPINRSHYHLKVGMMSDEIQAGKERFGAVQNFRALFPSYEHSIGTYRKVNKILGGIPCAYIHSLAP